MIVRDEGPAVKKEQELKQTLAAQVESSFGSIENSVIDKIVEESVHVQGPEVDRSIHQIEANESGGRSLKPGNIWFRPTKILDLAASGSLTGDSAVRMPVLVSAAAIILWTLILRGVSENVTTEEASVYWTIWKNSDEDGLTPADDLNSLVKEEMNNAQVNIKLDDTKIEKAIAALDGIDALQIVTRRGREYCHARERCRVSWR